MLRDHHKTDAYFTNYLEEQEKRINRFNEKLNHLLQENKPEEKIRLCHGFLATMLHDKLYAQYSLGYKKDELEKTFRIYLDHIKVQKRLTYQEAMETISLSIVFRTPIQDNLTTDQIPLDDLLQAMYCYHRVPITSQTNNGLLFPDTSMVFWETLQGKKSGTELRQYVERNWYNDNKDAPWFNADQREDNTYCGYWCFLGAAIAIIMGFGKELFEGCPYFPLDVL